jgi:hypothetical protein
MKCCILVQFRCKFNHLRASSDRYEGIGGRQGFYSSRFASKV